MAHRLPNAAKGVKQTKKQKARALKFRKLATRQGFFSLWPQCSRCFTIIIVDNPRQWSANYLFRVAKTLKRPNLAERSEIHFVLSAMWFRAAKMLHCILVRDCGKVLIYGF